MANVLGIGGVFVKSKDPDALRAWCRDVLGLELGRRPGVVDTRQALRGADAVRGLHRVFAPSDRELMVNFRVDDLDGLLARLRDRGAQVLDRREEDGKFGYVMDPDGTLELWQPPTA